MTLISRVLPVSAIVTGLRHGNCPHQFGLQPAPYLQRENLKAAPGSDASGCKICPTDGRPNIKHPVNEGILQVIPGSVGYCL